jgi:hypothetical protein
MQIQAQRDQCTLAKIKNKKIVDFLKTPLVSLPKSAGKVENVPN